MSAARDRIAEAVKDKPDGAFVALTAGDVVEAAGPSPADPVAAGLRAGAAAVRPDKTVYQRAEQVRRLLAAAGD